MLFFSFRIQNWIFWGSYRCAQFRFLFQGLRSFSVGSKFYVTPSIRKSPLFCSELEQSPEVHVTTHFGAFSAGTFWFEWLLNTDTSPPDSRVKGLIGCIARVCSPTVLTKLTRKLHSGRRIIEWNKTRNNEVINRYSYHIMKAFFQILTNLCQFWTTDNFNPRQEQTLRERSLGWKLDSARLFARV